MMNVNAVTDSYWNWPLQRATKRLPKWQASSSEWCRPAADDIVALKTAKRSTQGSEQKEKLGCTVPLSTLTISASANPGSGARIRGFSIQQDAGAGTAKQPRHW